MKARELAFSLLCSVCIDKKYSNLVLKQELHKVHEKDRGLVTQIVYGTLQNARYCRYCWEGYVKKLPEETIAVLLDMSVYQLFFMDKVPSYAVVNEGVEIVRKHAKSYVKLVNAVLRRCEREGKREVKGTKEEQLALLTSHPLWLVQMWKAQYGYEIAEKICYENMQVKKQCARVNTLKTTREELLKDARFSKGIGEDALLFEGEALAQTSYFKEGMLSIQDESSQMVAYMVQPKAMDRVLDVCSAPGTKACHMAQLMNNQGSILCGDLHEHRVALIEEGAKRLGISIIQARCMDALDLHDLEDRSFDAVLCDVPCSGYGVLSGKSDIKYHMQSNDMDTLIPLQQQILCNASTKVKPNGVLVYSTCTLNKKENEKQIQKFLKEHSEFILEKEMTVFPFTYHSDGFYMARLVLKQQ